MRQLAPAMLASITLLAGTCTHARVVVPLPEDTADPDPKRWVRDYLPGPDGLRALDAACDRGSGVACYRAGALILWSIVASDLTHVMLDETGHRDERATNEANARLETEARFRIMREEQGAFLRWQLGVPLLRAECRASRSGSCGPLAHILGDSRSPLYKPREAMMIYESLCRTGHVWACGDADRLRLERETIR